MQKWPMLDTFFSTAYSSYYVLRDRKLFEWMLCREDAPDLANMICAISGDLLVGIMAYTPTTFFWGDFKTRHYGAWTANWMVLPAYRTGLGWILMRHVQKKHNILIGHNAGADNLALAPRLGFTVYDPMPKYIAIFDSTATNVFLKSLKIHCSEEVVKGFVFTPRSNSIEKLEPISTPLTEETYSPDWNLYSPMKFGTVRDYNYLNHRYFRHPYFNYYILIIGSANQPVVVIYRIEEVSGPSPVKVGRILEFYHPQHKNGIKQACRAISYVADFFKNKGCAYSDFFCSSSLYGQTMIDCGFHLDNTLFFPHRLTPAEAPRLETCQNLEIYSRITPEAPPLSDCYITKSDGDQDRPNFYFQG